MAADMRTHLPLVLAVCAGAGTGAAGRELPTIAPLQGAAGAKGSAAGVSRPVNTIFPVKAMLMSLFDRQQCVNFLQPRQE